MSQTIAHSEAEAHAESAHHHHELSFFNKYIWSEDHKTIAIQYLFASLFFLLIGGLLAMGVRYQLAFSGAPIPLIGTLLPKWLVTDAGAIQPQGYNGLVTMHATVMVFLVVMPLLVGVFGNFLIPLKIGAPDMAFPFFNALSFWLFALSGIIILSSFLVPTGFPAAGWTSYAPLSANGAWNGSQAGQSCWCVGIFINGLASIAGAVNYITTIINTRTGYENVPAAAPGLGAFHHRDFVAASGARAFGCCRYVVFRSQLWHLFFFGESLWPAVNVAAPFLVLWPSRGLHLDSPSHGPGFRVVSRFLAKTDLRLQSDGLCDGSDWYSRLRRVGPPHVRERNESYVIIGVLVLDHVDRRPVRD